MAKPWARAFYKSKEWQRQFFRLYPTRYDLAKNKPTIPDGGDDMTKLRADRTGQHRTNYEKNKKKILATQDTCGICGQPVDKSLKSGDPMAPTIDHIIPVNGPGGVQGHPSDISNLQLAHWVCNRQKSNKLFKNIETKKPMIIGNRNLPQSMNWAEYKASD